MNRLKILFASCLVLCTFMIVGASTINTTFAAPSTTLNELLETSEGPPPQKHYAWYPSNLPNPITARAAYTDTPCESIFGFLGAGETLSWDGQSGSCSGDTACNFPGCDLTRASSGGSGERRHSTIEILDEEDKRAHSTVEIFDRIVKGLRAVFLG